MARFKFQHLLFILLFISFTLFYSNRASPRPIASSLSFCPITTARKHVPTVILQANGASDRASNRTYSTNASLLPFSYPPKEMRFAQKTAAGGSTSWNDNAGRGNLHGGVGTMPEEGQQLCPVFQIPSSPPPFVPSSWSSAKIMFGMSTSPDRVLNNLPVWSHWLPASSTPLDPASSAANALPLILILTPPPNPTEAARTREALEEAQSLGLNVKMRATQAARFETRYFSLVQEMWNEAQAREKQSGIVTEWFVFADDDTFFPNFSSLARMLAAYSSAGDHLIGALSESTKQVAEWGHIAYGGAGIYVSRALVAKMNGPSVWGDCLERFGSSFGGDAMVSQCAAQVLSSTVKEILKVEPTLHQLDIRGDSTGWFQSGFLITSLHHWGSWFTVFPPWIESGTGDQRKGIMLVGKASESVGGDNWGRRYVFENGRVMISLGYSVSIFSKPVPEVWLDQSEHTWSEYDSFYPMRPLLEEGLEKRTYYLTAVRTIDISGVVRLEHKNREGERIDVIFDGRLGMLPQAKRGWKDKIAKH